MTDNEIIELFFNRSEQAIAELASKHGAAVGKVAVNILGDLSDAEECVNDTWLGVWNAIPPERPQQLRSYVCRIARNLALKRFHFDRAQKRNSSYDAALEELSYCISVPDTVEAEFAARQLSETINRFLESLPYEDRFIFVRRYWYADSITELARMTKMGYNTVSQRLHRMRIKLKKILEGEG
ncbi:MAG: sigma-70 family RNA polymerase sigma factor [Ruminococcaceae bacterium]|nr:sigma-70 family RNA polymerase sigma factor [Oscillospiraceae bacterium]